jgi:hypothetical protein
MGSISTVSTVKWLWFLINIAALAGVLIHLARVFKAGADAKGGEVAQLYGLYLFYFEILPMQSGNKIQDHFLCGSVCEHWHLLRYAAYVIKQARLAG